MNIRDVTERQKVRYAAVGLVLIGMLLAVAVNFQRLPLVGGGETYHALFSDAAGLKVGEEVRVAGVKVGQVTDIALQGAAVRVTFRVKGVDLGKKTTAGIEVKTLLGQHYVSLDPAGEGNVGSDSTIPLARTTTPVNLVPVFDQLTKTADRLDTAQLATAFESLAGTLSAAAPEMTPALEGLRRLSNVVNNRDEGIADLLRQARVVSGTVAARDRDLGQLLAGADRVFAVLDRRRADIVLLIDGVEALSRQVSGVVRDNKKAIGTTLGQLDDVLAILKKNRSTIDQAITMLDLYGREFTAVAGTGRHFDGESTLPKSLSVCITDSGGGRLRELLGPLLTSLNERIDRKSEPCVPLGIGSRNEP
ncbi:MAG: MCE family protein [Propionibacteriales bacterium]|nr:MCE family protein [Propionibacteriales bacterium]